MCQVLTFPSALYMRCLSHREVPNGHNVETQLAAGATKT